MHLLQVRRLKLILLRVDVLIHKLDITGESHAGVSNLQAIAVVDAGLRKAKAGRIGAEPIIWDSIDVRQVRRAVLDVEQPVERAALKDLEDPVHGRHFAGRGAAGTTTRYPAIKGSDKSLDPQLAVRCCPTAPLAAGQLNIDGIGRAGLPIGTRRAGIKHRKRSLNGIEF